jgi:hypothetical protein
LNWGSSYGHQVHTFATIWFTPLNSTGMLAES